MDWPHRRAAYSRVPPLHLPQGACTRLCVLAQAKRSTANARALGGFRVAEPLMQRTGRLPVQVECCASGMPGTEQCLARSRTPFPCKAHRMRLLPEQAEQSTRRPLKQHFNDGTYQCIDHCRAFPKFHSRYIGSKFPGLKFAITSYHRISQSAWADRECSPPRVSLFLSVFSFWRSSVVVRSLRVSIDTTKTHDAR